MEIRIDGVDEGAVNGAEEGGDEGADDLAINEAEAEIFEEEEVVECFLETIDQEKWDSISMITRAQYHIPSTTKFSRIIPLSFK